MYLFFSIIFLVELILQVILLVKVKKNGLKKDWHNFLGINIGLLVSDIIVYNFLSAKTIGFSSAFSVLLVCGFALIVNVLLLIVGFLMKRKIKKEKKKYLLSGFLVFILNLVIMISTPLLISKITLNKGVNYVIDYLNKKYGEANYEIKNVYEGYEDVGIIDSYLSSYYFEVKSDYAENTFIITVDDKFNYISEDYFIPVYFSEKFGFDYNLKYNEYSKYIDYNFDEFNEHILNNLENKSFEVRDLYTNFVNSWNNVDGTEYSENYYIISENYGSVPNFDELINLIRNSMK